METKQKEETMIVVTKPTQLEEIVKSSGLAIVEGEAIKQSYLPYINQLAEIQTQSSKIDFENPTEIDEKIARELRLKTVKIRTGSEEIKNSRKNIHQLKANLEQAAWNLISASCKLTEDVFIRVEKQRELALIKSKNERKELRISQLTELEFDYTFTDLFNMDEDSYLMLVSKLETEKTFREEARIKSEQQAILEAKFLILHKERLEQIIPYIGFLSDDEQRMNFGILSETEFSNILDSAVGLKLIQDKEQDRIIKENEILKKEMEEKEKLAQAEKEEEAKKQAEILKLQKEKADKELAEVNRIAEIEAKKQAEVIAKQKEESDRFKAELEVKREAEQKENQRIEFEKRAKEKAEKEAESASDKVKFTKWINDFNIPILYTGVEENALIATDIINKFSSFKKWALSEIQKIK